MKAEKLQSIEQLPFSLKTELSKGLTQTQSKSKSNIQYWTISLVVHALLFVLAIYFMPTVKEIENTTPQLQTYLVKAKPDKVKPIVKHTISAKLSQEETITEVVESKPENIETNKQ